MSQLSATLNGKKIRSLLRERKLTSAQAIARLNADAPATYDRARLADGVAAIRAAIRDGSTSTAPLTHNGLPPIVVILSRVLECSPIDLLHP